ncbi:signal peptidase I [Natranaerobius thermophilus JW/NM-WN-LF]|uniref:Signal peptidase I n=2 Tax=Natranaerobius TaxID=375928 RepID=B2A2P4_NATTJ|nr:signal peptidase I [Natranaerobius thermophilus]ACB84957.1 signal peptidase I [Natranaerobius thermophilus JW/NM-WN-LF]
MTTNKSREVFEWIKSLVVAVLLALLIRYFVVEIFLVEGQSMYPTLENSQRLIVNKFVYRFREPDREDVIVFEYSDDKDFIKRVIALPGEEIKISEGQVYIDGDPLDESEYETKKINDNYGPEAVPEDKYFVLGDNRDNSMDSRSDSVGFIHEDKIKGKAFLIFWPLDDVGSI